MHPDDADRMWWTNIGPDQQPGMDKPILGLDLDQFLMMRVPHPLVDGS